MTIAVEIPGLGAFGWRHLVLDLNGTLALDGALLEGVAPRVAALSRLLEVHLLTADTHGTGARAAAELGISLHRLAHEAGTEARQKAEFVAELGAESVIAIGNGANDVEMLRLASLGIAVLGPEGAARAALDAADLLARDIREALDLLLHPQRLAATLRR